VKIYTLSRHLLLFYFSFEINELINQLISSSGIVKYCRLNKEMTVQVDELRFEKGNMGFLHPGLVRAWKQTIPCSRDLYSTARTPPVLQRAAIPEEV